MDGQGISGAGEIDEQVFQSLLAAADGDRPPPSLVVFDYDRTLTLETFNSAINDYVSGWKAQIDPWRVLHEDSDEEDWDTYDGRLTAEGLTAEELREEFHQGRHAQQSMQDYLRASFNNGERKAAAVHHAEFLEEEVHNRSKRLYHLRHLLETIRAGLDQQTPRGKMVIMTYNTDGAIFVLNTMIHAELSLYFDAIHSPLNCVGNVGGKWTLVCKDTAGSSPTNSRRRQTVTELEVEGCNVGRIHVHTGGRIATDSFGGKAHGVERMYKECGGLRNAVLVDDDPDLIAAWTELGGAYRVDLSQAPGDHKLTVAYIKQAEQCFERWLGRKPHPAGAPAGAAAAPAPPSDRAPVDPSDVARRQAGPTGAHN